MSEEVQVDGTSYISSKRAAELSGYAQDYIGQLARKSLIDARRIGGLWYVSMGSLLGYQKKAEEFKPEPPSRAGTPSEPETLVFFDGKEYFSAARAAEVTGYAQDYVGQLARSGAILSQQVGNRWYVEKQSILRHKSEKDALLAAVQSESVGLAKQRNGEGKAPEYLSNISRSGSGPVLNYFSEGGDLLPVLGKQDSENDVSQMLPVREPEIRPNPSQSYSRQTLPIRRVREYSLATPAGPIGRQAALETLRESSRGSFLPILVGAAATIIIVLSVGYVSVFKQDSVYAANIRQTSDLGALPASVATAFEKLGDILEPLLTHQLVYERSDSQ